MVGDVSAREGNTRENNEGVGGSSSGKSLLSVCINNRPSLSYNPIFACKDSSKISKLFLTTASINRDCRRLSLLIEIFSSCKKGSICPKICVASTSDRIPASLSCTTASGAPIVGVPGQDGLGYLSQGMLESSNVNSIEELVNMITTQRAYEMNSKVISAADGMLSFVNQQL